jgi:hypothetical protein
MRQTLFLFLVAMAAYAEESVTNQTQTSPLKGILEGRVKIGPLHPGPVRPDEKREMNPKIYESHRIAIWRSDNNEKILELKIDGKGYFKTELDPGKYLVDFTPHDLGIHRERSPQEVTIEEGTTTKLDFDIDTGIR